MIVDAVGIPDIATRAGVQRDTAKKWIERHDNFPKPVGRIGRSPAWEWSHVEHWLRMSGRLPMNFRYRWMGDEVWVQSPQANRNGRDRWVTLAVFIPHGHDDGFSAWPKPALKKITDDPKDAAQRLLESWERARVAWVKEHPDKPMPAHLAGFRADVDLDEARQGQDYA